MGANHGRSSRYLNVFPGDSELALVNQVLRISDMESCGDTTRIIVHQFGDMEQKVPPHLGINLLVWGVQVRFLLPSVDARPTSWRACAAKVGDITQHYWAPWNLL